MRLETFFNKLDELADTPNGVEKLRELVLRLAFSGGLTGKRPIDDGIPEGWEIRTIESISASITPGFACSRSHQVENGHVHLRTHNISTLGMLNFDLLVRIDPKMVDPKKASIRAGDILFNNTNSQELVGKTSLVDRDYDYGFSNHITRIRLKDGIFPGFVVFYLTLLRNSGYFARLCTRWINQAAVNSDTLKEQTVPVPPLAEQKRIVAKVNELMALCDRLEAQQQERETRHAALARASLARFADAPNPANLNFVFHPSYSISPADLRKSILSLAVQGKLVPQDPNDEPAEDVLERLNAQKELMIATKEMRRSRKTASIEEADEPYEIPKIWKWCRLGEVGNATDSAIVDGPFGQSIDVNSDYVASGVPVIRMVNVKPFEFVAGNLKFIRPEKFASLKRHNIVPGDVLLGKVGSIGLCAIYPDSMPEGMLSTTGLCRFRVGELISPRFLCIFLNSIADYLRSIASEAVQPFLNMKTITSIAIPIPPLAEQRRVVAKVDQLMSLVDTLETQLAASRATAANLLEALVAELTAGKESHVSTQI